MAERDAVGRSRRAGGRSGERALPLQAVSACMSHPGWAGVSGQLSDRWQRWQEVAEWTPQETLSRVRGVVVRARSRMLLGFTAFCRK